MAADQFTSEEKKSLVDAIKNAELNTSGEIRLHIENKCKEDVLDFTEYTQAFLNRAESDMDGLIFKMEQMEKTNDKKQVTLSSMKQSGSSRFLNKSGV